MFNPGVLLAKIEENLEEKNFLLKNFYGQKGLVAAAVAKEAKKYADKLKPYMANTVSVLNSLLKKGKKVIFEGAQGALLDIDFGTYPYVTSSNPTIGGVMTGAGVSHRHIKKVWGITKAYQTRVGNGPFPTELDEALGSDIREAGGEYGATTGRARRCGWLDLVALKYVCELNGLSDILLTKIDVLSILKEIKVCTHYIYKGKKTQDFVSDGEELYTVKPVYKTLKGWESDLTKARKYSDLPKAAKAYIKFIEDYTGVKVSMVSVGPERDQILKA
jgi:adenylosuccinate synthase